MSEPKYNDPYPDPHAPADGQYGTAVEDPLVELARIVSESSGLDPVAAPPPAETHIPLPADYAAPPPAAAAVPAYAEAPAADLESQLLDELRQSIDPVQEQPVAQPQEYYPVDQPIAEGAPVYADDAAAGAAVYGEPQPGGYDYVQPDPAAAEALPAAGYDNYVDDEAAYYADPNSAGYVDPNAAGYADPNAAGWEQPVAYTEAAPGHDPVYDPTYDPAYTEAPTDPTAYDTAAYDPAAYDAAAYAAAAHDPAAVHDPAAYDAHAHELGTTLANDPYDATGYVGTDIYSEADPTADAGEGVDVLPPHPPEETAAAPHPSRRRGMAVAVTVIALVVVGAAAFIGYRAIADGAGAGPPKIIMADTSPVKVKPDEAAASPNGSKLIYDRVGTENDTGSERLIDRTEEPVRVVGTRSVNSSGDTPSNPATADTRSAEPETPARSRKVRTVVIRPDGTIISEPEGANPSTPPANADAPVRTVNTTPVVGDTPSQPTTDTPVREPAASAATNDTAPMAPASPAADEAKIPIQDSTPGTPRPRARPVVAAAVEPVASEPRATQPAQPARTATKPKKNAPMALLPGNNASPAAPAAPARSAATSGNYAVQVASRKTRGLAQNSYAGLQRRYPSVLSGRAADYAPVNLGDRGTFYRVMVGPMGRSEANRLCQSLKSAGGDCLVKRR